ncbi:hypothetical protein GN958_ATG15213 [Phytophthora infestans]|uniref:Uncharacterized protein n=1 Tax=Phytophthora infestans TaxID=4787 RepID=A0A8S9U3P5_PHYIN|nr:hypothetical protein GN958_ATG15213 [Phytophthora infestans]
MMFVVLFENPSDVERTAATPLGLVFGPDAFCLTSARVGETTACGTWSSSCEVAFAARLDFRGVGLARAAKATRGDDDSTDSIGVDEVVSGTAAAGGATSGAAAR